MKRPYFVISMNSAEALGIEVEKAMKDGYTPLGGVSIAMTPKVSGTLFLFAQAMVSKP